MIRFTLPFPPSVNRYWRRVGPRTLISREGRQFRDRVCRILAERPRKPLTGELALAITLHPPDRRTRDADNFCKATLDALEHAGAYENDAQIAHLQVHRRDRVPGGQTVVSIEPYVDYLKRQSELYQLVCCAGCGRDTFRHIEDVADAYCARCLTHGDDADDEEESEHA
ncbi:RusA family crossover junction endodeoxyribonuclease [Maioricimonas sp. JC845]|uniref:RusA family crossover junction endodeoxyribonuclease n=1 Tax=Maioricimonas sp. JC845 TaxID=3232138 RepID=UPI003457F0EC